MATKTDSQDLSNLVINRVASYSVFQDMIEHGQVNENELYLIEGDAQSVTYSISKSGGTITLTGSDGSTSTVTVATKTSDLTNDSGFITSSSVPSASTTTPKMDGTASYGSGTTWARADHVHPTDTSRASASDLSSHTSNTSNPHSVTAAQIGAATSSHTHGNITNDGKVGSTSGYSVYTTTGGAVTAGSLSTSDPTASGTSTTFIATASQDAKGKMTLTKSSVPTASSSVAGITTVGASGGAAAYSHGTHVTYSTTAPASDGTASAGSASTVARSDHVHPTDTSRASASDLSSHTGNTSNPHSVTAAQVGAVPTSRTVNSKALSSDISLTASDVGAASSSDLSSHTGNTSNPHNVTASQVGAAPTAHASSSTTYGVGTSSNYGHVKLSDSTTSTSGASSGVAATPAAVNAASNMIKRVVIEKITTSCTWTAPAAIDQSFRIYGVGGGGSGSKTGGGGGGGYVNIVTATIAQGTNVTVTCGAGGVFTSTTNYTDGGNSSFGNYCTANGGKTATDINGADGGAGGGGSGYGSSGATAGAGGAGGTYGGGGGGGAGGGSGTTPSSAGVGGAGGTYGGGGGGGGNARNSTRKNGGAGGTYGGAGGAGGSNSTYTGANGSNGTSAHFSAISDLLLMVALRARYGALGGSGGVGSTVNTPSSSSPATGGGGGGGYGSFGGSSGSIINTGTSGNINSPASGGGGGGGYGGNGGYTSGWSGNATSTGYCAPGGGGGGGNYFGDGGSLTSTLASTSNSYGGGGGGGLFAHGGNITTYSIGGSRCGGGGAGIWDVADDTPNGTSGGFYILYYATS